MAAAQVCLQLLARPVPFGPRRIPLTTSPRERSTVAAGVGGCKETRQTLQLCVLSV